MEIHWDVIVIGAGAAGLLAAARAAELGHRVLLLEKNRKPGVKILMSGSTRCNLTHATDARGIVEAFGPRGRFLHSALAALGPDDVVELFEAEGVTTKVEATGKIFPESNKALHVLEALLARLDRSGAELSLGQPVLDIEPVDEDADNSGFQITTAEQVLFASKVILTTGGQSYPGCGTTGDGYAWAVKMGHSIASLRAALVPVTTRADWAKSLRGIAVPDAVVSLRQAADDQTSASGKAIDQRRGAMLFTHFGLSGPVVMDLSGGITSHPRPRSLELVCDFLPEVNAESLAERIRNFQQSQGKKQISNLPIEPLPKRLVEALIEQAGLPLEQRAAELSRSQLTRLVQAFKSTALPVTGTLGFEKAEVTAGGVDLSEVDSRTMQSKRTANLFLAGEILDLDGPIGGYNFQSAFSTAWLAAESV